MRTVWVILILLSGLSAPAQQDSARLADSATLRDSATKRPDSLTQLRDSLGRLQDTTFQKPIDTPKIVVPAFSLFLDSSVYNHQPYFSFTNPVKRLTQERQWQGKEPLFYSTVVLLIFFALVRNNYSRYATDLFAL